MRGFDPIAGIQRRLSLSPVGINLFPYGDGLVKFVVSDFIRVRTATRTRFLQKFTRLLEPFGRRFAPGVIQIRVRRRFDSHPEPVQYQNNENGSGNDAEAGPYSDFCMLNGSVHEFEVDKGDADYIVVHQQALRTGGEFRAVYKRAVLTAEVAEPAAIRLAVEFDMTLRNELFVDDDIAAGGGADHHSGIVKPDRLSFFVGVEIHQLMPCGVGRFEFFHIKCTVANGELIICGEVFFLNFPCLVENPIPASGIAQAQPPLAHQNDGVMPAGDIVLFGNHPGAVRTSADGDGIGSGEIGNLVQHLVIEFKAKAQSFRCRLLQGKTSHHGMVEMMERLAGEHSFEYTAFRMAYSHTFLLSVK